MALSTENLDALKRLTERRSARAKASGVSATGVPEMTPDRIVGAWLSGQGATSYSLARTRAVASL